MSKQITITKEQLYFLPAVEFDLPVVFMVINQQIGLRISFYLPADKSHLKHKHQQYCDLVNGVGVNVVGLPLEWVFNLSIDPQSGFCKLVFTDTENQTIPYVGFIRDKDLIDEIAFIMGVSDV